MAEAKIEIVLSNGAKAGQTLKELGKTANALNKEIRDLKPGTEEFVAKAKDLQEVAERLEEIKKQVKGTNEASAALKNAFNQFVPFSGTFSQLGQSLSGAKGGVGGLISSFGALRTAIIGTGIGALVVLLVGLVQWFTKTDEGADLLEDTMTAVSSVVDVLTSRLVNIGKTLKDLFTNPVKFFKDIAADVEKAVAANQEYVNSLRDIEDAQYKLDIQAAENEKTVTRLLAQSKNVSLSFADRLDLLKQASAVETDFYNQQLDHATKVLKTEETYLANKLKLMNQEVDFTAKTNEEIIMMAVDGAIKKGTATDDEFKKYQDAVIEKIKLDTSYYQLQENINNRESQLLDKQQAAIDKALAERKKKLDEARKLEEEQMKALAAAYANYEDLRLQLMADGRKRELAQLELDTARKIEQVVEDGNLVADRVLALQELQRQKEAEINKKWDKQEEDERKRKQAEEEKRLKDALAKELKIITDAAFNEQLAVLEKFSKRKIDHLQFEEDNYKISKKSYEDQLALLQSRGQQETEEYKKIYESLLNLNIAHNQQIKANNQQQFADALTSASSIGSALAEYYQSQIDAQRAKVDATKAMYGEESQAYKDAQNQLLTIQKANGERVKRAEKAQVGVNLLSEVSSIWKNAAQLGPWGYLLAAVQTVAAGLRAKSAITKINATQFEKGGILHGKRHSQGGIPGLVRSTGEPIEMEDGEIILNRNVGLSSIGRRLASDLNYKFGGRKFESGGPINPISSAGNAAVVQSSSLAPSSDVDSASSIGILARKLDQVITVLNVWPTKLRVENVLTETADGLKTLNQIRNDASV